MLYWVETVVQDYLTTVFVLGLIYLKVRVTAEGKGEIRCNSSQMSATAESGQAEARNLGLHSDLLHDSQGPKTC